MSFYDSIDASVSYSQNKYALTESRGDILDSLKTRFSRVVLQGSREAADCRLLRELGTAQGFLHGGGLPFEAKRAVIEDFTISHPTLPITGSAVMVSMFPEIGIVNVLVGLTLRGAATDQLVFLRHMQGNGEKLTLTFADGHTESLTVTEIIKKITDCFGELLRGGQSAYLLEINAFCGYDELPELLRAEAKRLYGVLTGDEGWEYVPEALARERISSSWGSRSFVAAIAFSNNFMLINLLSCKTAADYEDHQRRFFTDYYGAANPYFHTFSTFAGINHGILFAVETGTIIEAFCQSILEKQNLLHENKSGGFSKSIRRMKEYRRDLVLTINRVDGIGMSELGELQGLVLESLKIAPVVDRLKSLLELLESDLDLEYSTRTNVFVNLLAILGLLMSLMQVLGLFSIW